MRLHRYVIVFIFGGNLSLCQPGDGFSPPLDSLVTEAIGNNPEIRAALHEIAIAKSRITREAGLDDPSLTYMREEMPGFRFADAMYSKIELMQMFRFPTKYGTQRTLADIQVTHAYHRHLEKINEVIAHLKQAYIDLWFIQQKLRQAGEHVRLMKRMAGVAELRFSTGSIPQADVLKLRVELIRLENDIIALRQEEIGTKALITAILSRAREDTVGVAVLPDELPDLPPLESLLELASRRRPLLLDDSLSVEEARSTLSLAGQGYLPDFSLGITYVRQPNLGLGGWSVSAGISLPFAPWVLPKAAARVEEAEASIRKAEETLKASQAYVQATLTELYNSASSRIRQLSQYRSAILPAADQALKATVTAYETGQTDFLMLLDAYRTTVDLETESLGLRREYELISADLERTVGIQPLPNNLPMR